MKKYSSRRFRRTTTAGGASNLCCQSYFRQQNSSSSYRFQRKNYVNSDLIQRLSLSHELEGHTGCVNCIQWNERGTILASGSDDYQVILWDPFGRRKLHAVRTGHINNIFAVQFLPGTDDRVILSGAGDNKIRMHDVNRPSGEECIQNYNCHFARVKRIAVTPARPHLFWSAGEDGIVMELDVRVPVVCNSTCEHALINLNAHTGYDAEVKCIAINPTRPELLAVGANDPYVRVFDRRMLSRRKVSFTAAGTAEGISWDRGVAPLFSLSADNENYDFPLSSCQYYCAGHLPVKHKDFRRRYRPLATTYLTFGPQGKDLLVNLGGEQIYLFDITKQGRRRSLLSVIREKIAASTDFSLFSCAEAKCHEAASNGYHIAHTSKANGYTNGISVNGKINSGHLMPPESKLNSEKGKQRQPLPHRAEALKQRANRFFEQQSFTDAIELYSEALNHAPDAPVLTANRAAAYMKRAWDGDVYAAMRDCFRTLELEGDHLKALFRLARCLFELKHPVEAQCCLDLFKKKFPDHAKSPAYSSLDRDIKDVLFSEVTSESNGKSYCTTRKRSRKEQKAGAESSESSSESREDISNKLSEQEHELRLGAVDYDLRFCGHCNTTTDIKEANFFGCYGEYIVAGSDDGTFFIWESATCRIVSVLRGDESIVNCLQPHPAQCLLATSGIESNVKLWAPRPEDGSENSYFVSDMSKTATANQRRMNADPLEVMLFNMGYRIGGLNPGAANSPSEPGESNITTIQCRQS